MNKKITVTLAMICWLWAPAGDAMQYQAYNGFSGYQEFRVYRDTYFVAYHGDTDFKRAEVEQAWRIRSAELCNPMPTDYFIELRYVSEPVLKDDPPFLAYGPSMEGGLVKVHGGGFVYIPIYSGSSGRYYVSAPSKQAYVRCIHDSSQVLDPSRLNSIPKILDQARSAGLMGQGDKPR